MGNATFYRDGLKCLIMITVSHFHLTIDWQNNTKPILIVLLFSGHWEWTAYLTLGSCYFWGLFGAMSFFTLLYKVITLIPRCTLFSILPLKACKHWFVIHFNIRSIFIATFILSSIPFMSPFYVLVTAIKDHVDVNRIAT